MRCGQTASEVTALLCLSLSLFLSCSVFFFIFNVCLSLAQFFGCIIHPTNTRKHKFAVGRVCRTEWDAEHMAQHNKDRQFHQKQSQVQCSTHFFFHKASCSLPLPKLLQYYLINHLKSTPRMIAQTLCFQFSTYNQRFFCESLFAFHTADRTLVEWFLCPNGFFLCIARGSITNPAKIQVSSLHFCQKDVNHKSERMKQK